MADTAKIKQRLNRHRRRVLECESMKEEVRYIVESYGDVKSVSFDAMPRGSNVKDSRLERQVLRKVDLEERIAKREKELTCEWQSEIEPMLDFLNPTEALVIRLRYFHAAEWADICRQVYGKQDDYKDDPERCMNRTYKLHGKALLALAEHYQKT